ncbi:VWA domain-containing protein [Streptomyces sp. HPF1205]|uniref:vWA domain-containing protein n=1 Tax=Streptomyces sp. HPF1205 TaxID=2873262 RepID=UPI001CEDBE7B|nr:VWA domain-containing protein [Streptomyces sp. HPF1205]
MSAFTEGEKFAIFPVILVVDVSLSMSGQPLAEINKALPAMQQAIIDDPTTGEVARVAVVTFSDSATCVLPLCDIAQAQLPFLTVQGGTNFTEGLRMARETIISGIQAYPRGTSYHQPVVFFISDGEHNAYQHWGDEFARLTDKQDKYGAQVVSFGFGDANRDVIAQVSTGNAFFSRDVDPAVAVREILHTILRSIRMTSGTIQSGASAGLVVPTDADHFTRLPVRQS